MFDLLVTLSARWLAAIHYSCHWRQEWSNTFHLYSTSYLLLFTSNVDDPLKVRSFMQYCEQSILSRISEITAQIGYIPV